MAVKKKGEVRLTATVSLGEQTYRKFGNTTKKIGYLTIFKDELILTGLKEVAQTNLKAVRITRGKLAGRTIYTAVDDTAATGRHFQFLYLVQAAEGSGAKRKAPKYDAVQAYFPSWMTTRQIMGWTEAGLTKKPQFIVTDLGTRIKPLKARGTNNA